MAEAHLALYRRYRPARFGDLVGQGHVALALRRAVAEGRTAHAYLFSGPRGTGKTSAARILAMALNCEGPEDGEPCGTCLSCQAIRAGSSMDVEEHDGASKRGLDDMRALLAGVPLATPGQRKVYILDEVHQLTPSAAAALLKTLEEPPGHVCFVLATTEPLAVLETIRSRCQHFTFHLLADAELEALVAAVAADAGLNLPTDALAVAAREGAGSPRDALSALERIWLGGGAAVASPAPALAEALASRDSGGMLTVLAEAIAQGWQPQQIVVDLLGHLRQGVLALQAPALAGRDAGRAQVSARQMGMARLVRTMELLGRVSRLRLMADPRTSLEVTLLACAAVPSPYEQASVASLAERLSDLEAVVAALGAVQIPGPGSVQVPLVVPAVPVPTEAPVRPVRTEAPAGAVPARDALGRIRQVKAALRGGKAALNDLSAHLSNGHWPAPATAPASAPGEMPLRVPPELDTVKREMAAVDRVLQLVLAHFPGSDVVI